MNPRVKSWWCGSALYRSETVQRRIVFGLIAIVVCVTYWPSLFHIARGDHWNFLMQVAPYDNWWHTVKDFHSFNRTRWFDRGDVLLFRPLLFTLMATEWRLFGWNFGWWQVGGIALHIATAYTLLRLLWALQRGLVAALLSLLFATLFISQMAVSWQHINGYVLFVLLELATLYHVCRHVEEQQTHLWRLWLIVALVLAAGMTYEAGNVLGIACAAYLWRARGRWCVGTSVCPRKDISGDGGQGEIQPPEVPTHRRGWLVMLLMPAAVYGIWDWIDFWHLHPTPADAPYMVAGSMPHTMNIAKTVGSMVAIPVAYGYAALFPLLQKVSYGHALMARPVVWEVADSFSLAQPWPTLIASAATAVCLLAVGLVLFRRIGHEARTVQRVPAGPGWGFAVVVLTLLAAQLFLMVAGRAHMRGLGAYVLKESSYYAYLIMPLVLVLGYQVCRCIGFDAISRALGRRWRGVCAGLVVALSLSNACKVYAVNVHVKEQYPVPPALSWQGSDAITVCRYYQSVQDQYCENFLVLLAYSYQRYGLRMIVATVQEERGNAKFAYGSNIVGFDLSLVRAIQCNEEGSFYTAFGLLDPIIQQDANMMPPFTLEYERACRGSFAIYSAAITNMVGNPMPYQVRAVLNHRMDKYRAALDDLQQAKLLGGKVDPAFEKEVQALVNGTTNSTGNRALVR